MTENGIIGRLKLATFADEQKLLKTAGTMFENVAGNAMRTGEHLFVRHQYLPFFSFYEGAHACAFHTQGPISISVKRAEKEDCPGLQA